MKKYNHIKFLNSASQELFSYVATISLSAVLMESTTYDFYSIRGDKI